MSGLLIPPSAISSSKLDAPVQVTDNASKCPLCKAELSDESRRLASSLYKELHDAGITREEAQALRNLMTRHYIDGSSYSQIVPAIEKEVPKAAGLKKYIPPADVTGVLALIIATLTLVDEFVVNWTPLGKTESGYHGAAKREPDKHEDPEKEPDKPRRPSGWVKLSQPPIILANAADTRGSWLVLRGNWGSNTPRQSLEMYLYPHRSTTPPIVQAHWPISNKPGPWEFEWMNPSASRSYVGEDVYLLFVANKFVRPMINRMPLDDVARMGALAFRLAWSRSTIPKVERIPLEVWVKLRASA